MPHSHIFNARLISRYGQVMSPDEADVVLVSRCVASKGKGGIEVALVPDEIEATSPELKAAWEARRSKFFVSAVVRHLRCLFSCALHVLGFSVRLLNL